MASTETSAETGFDVVIVGGGTSGAALAGLLAKNPEMSVCLIEAGPDYGPFDGGKWPASLLDGQSIDPESHTWGYVGVAHQSHSEPTTYDRAKVIGGCSSHNGCIALLGHYRDYDHWVNLGNPGWAFGSVRPSFLRAMERLRVRQPEDDEVTPFQSLLIGGASAAGIPRVADLNHSGETSGVAAAPMNVYDTVRWNSAFAYLDDVRGQNNLTIIDNAMVARLEFDGNRVVGAVVTGNGESSTVRGKRVVLSAGAYGSPGILERSGVGDPAILKPLGIDVLHELPGVGKALVDHPAIIVEYRGSAELNKEMSDLRASGWCPNEQAMVKTRSQICNDAFDQHLYSVSNYLEDEQTWAYMVYVSCVSPRSHGEVHITSSDPETPPDIDHRYLSDPEGFDLAVMVDGVQKVRTIMQPALDSGMLEAEVLPGSDVTAEDAIRDHVLRNVGIYFHPACSCRMGPKTDKDAVVDSLGRVHGLENLWICDASIFPTLMRANSNLPAAMVAEHLAPVIAAGR